MNVTFNDVKANSKQWVERVCSIIKKNNGKIDETTDGFLPSVEYSGDKIPGISSYEYEPGKHTVSWEKNKTL